MKVSTVAEVLERFRQDIVAELHVGDFEVPPAAEAPGNCFEALAAWVRLNHRRVPSTARAVFESRELQQRVLDAANRTSLATIRSEFERGDDVTQRLTRRFYKAGFNDFLFNTFGIQHVHLGELGVGQDRTKQHAMSGSTGALLFIVVEPNAAYFVDVMEHDVFESAEMTKTLLQIIVRNWPNLLDRYSLPGIVESEMSFEAAFSAAKSGFTVAFEVDGRFFARGTVLDGTVTNGRRAPCTSTEVVDETNRMLNMVVALVQFVTREALALAKAAEARTGARPTALELEVVRAGRIVVLREQNSGLETFHDGRRIGLLAYDDGDRKPAGAAPRGG